MRTLWVIIVALGLGFTAAAQQQVNNFRVLTNLYVGGAITGVTLNGYNIDAVVTNSAAAKLDITNGVASGLSLGGTTIYSGDGSNNLTANTLFNLGLRGSNGETVSVYPTAHTTKNIASLVGLNTGLVTTNATVEVRGYYEPGDGGGGTFYYAPYEATNAGTIFQAGSGSFVWKKLLGSTFDIREYGAVAGGVTNCRNAIQIAINAAHAAGGGTVVIPPGDYRVAGPYIEFWPGVNLRGDGGVLWVSLPDSYDRVADLATGYGPSRAIVLTEPWVNSLGQTINGFTNTAHTFPWNGKVATFVNVENSVWDGVIIDGGWGENAYYTRPSGVISIEGVSSISGNSSSDEFTYYQMISVAKNSVFQNCAFYNAPGAIFSSPRFVNIQGCTFTDYGDHIVYVRAGTGATDADFVTFSGNHINAVRAQVGTAGGPDYATNPPSTNFVSATVRDAIKIQNSQNVSISGNTMLSADATFLTLECYPRTDGATTNSWIDTANIDVSGNVFSGHRFMFLLTSRRNNAGTVTTITALPAGQKLKNISVSHNTVKLQAATNWNGGSAKFISMTEQPSNGQDYGAALDTFKVEGNQITGSVVNVLIGNPEYAVGFTNVVFQGNQFYTSASGGLFQFGGRPDRIVFDDNILFQTDAQNTGGAAPLRSFDSRMFYGGEFTVRNNTALNYSTWLFENLANTTAAYNDATTYTYSTTAFGDHTLTNRSLARSASGEVYVNTTTTTGGGDPSTNANWAALTYPVLDLVLAENYKRCISTNTLTATERCGLLTYFYSPASQQMKYTARVTHSGNVNVGIYGDTSAYGLSSPPDVATHVVNSKPVFDIPSPLEPMGYVDAANSRIGFGYNFTTPATTVDVQANEFLFGADNGAPTTRTASTIKTARFNAPSYSATSASAGIRVSGFELQTASSYNSFTVGANSSSLYLPTIFEVRLGSSTTMAGNTASRNALYADGNLRLAINGTTFSGSEKLNVNGAAFINGSIDLGNSDTTLARSAPGVVTIEGLTVLDYNGTPTTGQIPVFTNGAWSVMSPGASGIGGSTGSTDNSLLRADGTGGATLQSSAVIVDDYTSSTANNVAIRIDDGSTANIAAVITPKGDGAFILGPKPDGTTTGGNARGQYAVDLQLSHAAWNQAVASGNYSLAGVYYARALGAYSVALGYGADASAAHAAAIGGHAATASGTYSFVGGGYASSASGQQSAFLAGQGSASATYAVGAGEAAANKRGQFGISGGSFAASGDSQSSIVTVRNSTTNTTATELFTDGSSGRLTLANNSAWTFEAKVTGITSGAAASYSYILTGFIRRGANAAATTMPAVATPVVIYESNAGADVSATADTTNGSLKIAVTAFDSTATRWSATVIWNQVGY